jgi:hypothetical protein
MQQPIDRREIELRTIDIADLVPNRVYPAQRLSYLDMLRATIERSGFIIPPVVVPAAAGTFEVVEGHRRIAVAKQLGKVSLKCCVILDAEGLDPGELFLRVMADQADREVRKDASRKQAAIVEWELRQG